MGSGITFVNFSYCELEGMWRNSAEEISSEVEVYESIEENAIINTRLSTEEKNHYYMKKGAKIRIKGHVLKFDKNDLA